MNSNNLLINLKGITFRYPGADPVLEDLDLKFYRGEKMGLVAPNGSGKTTLLHIIMGLLKPEAGQVEIVGELPKRAFRKFADASGCCFRTPMTSFFHLRCWKM